MRSYTVKTPVEGYAGEVAGVGFVRGEAVTDSAVALAYFKSAGYDIIPAEPEPEPEPEPTRPSTQDNKDAWVTYAKHLGADDAIETMTKGDVITWVKSEENS